VDRIAPFIAVAALVAVAFLMHKLGRLENRIKALQQSRPTLAPPSAAAPDVEVAHYMMRIQQHANKLWSAGRAGNLKLADFYRHELKEEMTAIARARIVDDGVPVSEHMEVYGLRTLEAFKARMAAHGTGDFDAQYRILIDACNSCHVTCGHPELRMRVPEHIRFDDQEF
jgi:hypothetical protein